MFEDRDHPSIFLIARILSFSAPCYVWAGKSSSQQHQHWRNTTRSKLMENVINSSASWPWSLTLAAPILPRKPDSVIAIRETLHPFVFCCNPSQAIDGLPYFFPTPILICSFIAKKRYTAYSQHLSSVMHTEAEELNINFNLPKVLDGSFRTFFQKQYTNESTL